MKEIQHGGCAPFSPVAMYHSKQNRCTVSLGADQIGMSRPLCGFWMFHLYRIVWSRPNCQYDRHDSFNQNRHLIKYVYPITLTSSTRTDGSMPSVLRMPSIPGIKQRMSWMDFMLAPLSRRQRRNRQNRKRISNSFSNFWIILRWLHCWKRWQNPYNRRRKARFGSLSHLAFSLS